VSKYTKNLARSGGTRGSTTLAGVRGKQAVSDEIELFEEDMEDAETFSAPQKGKDLFNEGRYVQATPVFEGLKGEKGTGDERAGSGRTASELTVSIRFEESFYLGVSLFNVLRYRETLPYLKESLDDKAADYYEPALFHFALTFYMLERYGEARSYFLEIQRDFGGSGVSAYASEELKEL
jgi:tetratricopeptide (TPR) repeat protein